MTSPIELQPSKGLSGGTFQRIHEFVYGFFPVFNYLDRIQIVTMRCHLKSVDKFITNQFFNRSCPVDLNCKSLQCQHSFARTQRAWCKLADSILERIQCREANAFMCVKRWLTDERSGQTINFVRHFTSKARNSRSELIKVLTSHLASSFSLPMRDPDSNKYRCYRSDSLHPSWPVDIRFFWPPKESQEGQDHSKVADGEDKCVSRSHAAVTAHSVTKIHESLLNHYVRRVET